MMILTLSRVFALRIQGTKLLLAFETALSDLYAVGGEGICTGSAGRDGKAETPQRDDLAARSSAQKRAEAAQRAHLRARPGPARRSAGGRALRGDSRRSPPRRARCRPSQGIDSHLLSARRRPRADLPRGCAARARAGR